MRQPVQPIEPLPNLLPHCIDHRSFAVKNKHLPLEVIGSGFVVLCVSVKGVVFVRPEMVEV